MATATTQESQATGAEVLDGPGEQRILLADIGWEGYEAILAIKGERRAPQLAYWNGSLELMSPGRQHESIEKRLSFLVNEMALGLRMIFCSIGQTTFRRRGHAAGIEADDTFYFANEAAIRGKKTINLDRDPPPDLAIEIEITHPLADREAIYAALGVPELWVDRRPARGQEARLQVLHLGADGQYLEVDASLAFPFLQAEEIDAWIRKPEVIPESDWMHQVRDWVRDILVPRHGGEPGGERP